MNSQTDCIQNIRTDNPELYTSIELTNLIILDIETTGLRPDRGAKIMEVSILNRYHQLFFWQRKGLTDEKLLSDKLPIIVNQLKKGVVVGHNLSFDFWFLSHNADKLNTAGLAIRFIDTLSLARILLPNRGSFKLSELLDLFNIRVNGELHNATTDSEATRALFWKLIEMGGISTVGEAGMKKLNWSSF